MAGKVMKCSYCGVVCFHNAKKKIKDREQEYRCTYCGMPPQGNLASIKYPYQLELANKQRARAFMRKPLAFAAAA